jgi:rhodanese-related sulfurtransferase
MRTLSYDQLKKMREQHEDFVLIDVLPEEAFNDAHIPDSLNIPLRQADFESQVQNAAGSKEKKVVVYCAGFECDASRNAAKKLDDAGFPDVYAYEGGVKEWQKKSGSQAAA